MCYLVRRSQSYLLVTDGVARCSFKGEVSGLISTAVKREKKKKERKRKRKRKKFPAGPTTLLHYLPRPDLFATLAQVYQTQPTLTGLDPELVKTEPNLFNASDCCALTWPIWLWHKFQDLGQNMHKVMETLVQRHSLSTRRTQKENCSLLSQISCVDADYSSQQNYEILSLHIILE